MHTTAMLILSCLVLPDVAKQMSEPPKKENLKNEQFNFEIVTYCNINENLLPYISM
jgi:hypothetical protein